MTDDLPRYTWSESAGTAHLYRRVGPYGQEHILTISIPSARLGDRELIRTLRVSANALCEHLCQREREPPDEPARA